MHENAATRGIARYGYGEIFFLQKSKAATHMVTQRLITAADTGLRFYKLVAQLDEESLWGMSCGGELRRTIG